MNYLFDSSAIFRLIRDNKVELLIGGHTVKLAQYEIGNIFWKEAKLHKRISEQEAKHLLSDAYKILSAMDIKEVTNEQEVLDLALTLGITFYDASYLYVSDRMEVPFVTDDERLKLKAEKRVKTILVNEI